MIPLTEVDDDTSWRPWVMAIVTPACLEVWEVAVLMSWVVCAVSQPWCSWIVKTSHFSRTTSAYYFLWHFDMLIVGFGMEASTATFVIFWSSWISLWSFVEFEFSMFCGECRGIGYARPWGLDKCMGWVAFVGLKGTFGIGCRGIYTLPRQTNPYLCTMCVWVEWLMLASCSSVCTPSQFYAFSYIWSCLFGLHPLRPPRCPHSSPAHLLNDRCQSGSQRFSTSVICEGSAWSRFFWSPAVAGSFYGWCRIRSLYCFEVPDLTGSLRRFQEVEDQDLDAVDFDLFDHHYWIHDLVHRNITMADQRDQQNLSQPWCPSGSALATTSGLDDATASDYSWPSPFSSDSKIVHVHFCADWCSNLWIQESVLIYFWAAFSNCAWISGARSGPGWIVIVLGTGKLIKMPLGWEKRSSLAWSWLDRMMRLRWYYDIVYKYRNMLLLYYCIQIMRKRDTSTLHYYIVFTFMKFPLFGERCWLFGQGRVDSRLAPYELISLSSFLQDYDSIRGCYRTSIAVLFISNMDRLS